MVMLSETWELKSIFPGGSESRELLAMALLFSPHKTFPQTNSSYKHQKNTMGFVELTSVRGGS